MSIGNRRNTIIRNDDQIYSYIYEFKVPVHTVHYIFSLGGGGGGVDSIILVKGNGDYRCNIDWMERGYLARVILNTTTETIILAGRKNVTPTEVIIWL